MALSELAEVRDKTTSDTSRLTDSKIQDYLDKYPDRVRSVRVLLAAADCCDFLASDIEFGSVSGDGVSVSNPLWDKKAQYYRELASTKTKGGVFIV